MVKFGTYSIGYSHGHCKPQGPQEVQLQASGFQLHLLLPSLQQKTQSSQGSVCQLINYGILGYQLTVSLRSSPVLVPQSYELRSSHREPRMVAGMVHSAAKEANPSYPHVFMLLQSSAPVKVTKIIYLLFFKKGFGFCLGGSDRNLVALNKHKCTFFT